MSKITSDTLLIGIDISDNETVMTIARPIGNKIVQIKQLHGEVAEQVYHDLVYREEIFEEVSNVARNDAVEGLKDALNIQSPSGIKKRKEVGKAAHNGMTTGLKDAINIKTPNNN